jgi:hypothetical protein
MRLEPIKDGLQHPTDNGEDDHHPAPYSVTINNTSQSLPPGTTYNLDISLPHSNFQIARVQITGAKPMWTSGQWREGVEILATRDSAEAMGHSIRETGSMYKVYAATYSKQNSDSYLSQKIFDNNTGSSNRYICLQDAVITGSTLRLTFLNTFGGSATLWVKGQALLW